MKQSKTSNKHVRHAAKSPKQTQHVKRGAKAAARQSWLQAKLANLDKLVKDDKSLRIAVPIGVVLVFVVSLFVLNGGSFPSLPGSGPTAEEYKKQLQAQVDDQNGSPRSGRDPADQGQTSLADAANKPTGAGTTDTPAAGVVGDHNTHNTSGDVYDDPNKTHLNASGCFIDYGIQGQECLPSHAVDSNGKLTCAGVKGHGFSNGIKVTGKDWAGLDRNHDGTACGNGD